VVSRDRAVPVYTTVIGALKPGNEVLQHPLVPGPFTLDGFSEAWTQGHLDRYLLNSFVVASIITIAQLVTALLSAYAFAMIDFPGRGLLFIVFLATLLVPLETTLVVNRRTIDSLSWLEHVPGLGGAVLATAFGTFLMRQVFIGLPADLRDAAAIDGVGHLGFLRHVGSHSCGRRSERWRCSASSGPGTSTCGRT
jgi:sn-glycerol 3-phosphate transport system permease protein